MRKLVAYALGIVVASAPSLMPAAEGPVKTKHAIDLQMQGQIDIGAIYRSQGFSYVHYGPCLSTAPESQHMGVGQTSPSGGAIATGRRIAPGFVDDRGSLSVIDPQISLGFRATLPKNVIGFVELSTPFYVIGDEGGTSPVRGAVFKEPYTSGYDRGVVVEQAYVDLRDFILEDSGLDVRLGIMDYALDFRGNGHPFLIDIQNAENPFLSPTGAQQYRIERQDGLKWYPTWDLTRPGDRRVDPGPFGRNTQEAAGVLARYATEDKGIFAADVYFFDIFESYEKNRDDFVTGATLSIYFDEDRRLGKFAPTFLAMANNSTACVYTFGAGAQGFPLDSVVGEKVLELYGEAYMQAGTYAKNVRVLESDSYPERRYHRIYQTNAYAFYVGTRLAAPRVNQDDVVEDSADAGAYDYFGGLQPYVDVSYWEVSGDTNADRKRNSNFVSLENNNLSLIVESSYWGLDIDSNYRCARVQTGFYPYKGWHLGAMYGYFEYQHNNGTADNRRGRTRSKIGDEVDVALTWEYSTHVKFQAGTGFLFDPRALGTTQSLNLSLVRMIVDF